MILRIIYGILSTALLFSLFYLLGAFSQANFNPSTWSESSLTMVSAVGGMFSLILGIIVVFYKQIIK